jgi:hypothetical protein
MKEGKWDVHQAYLAGGAVLERRLGGVALRLLPRVHLRRGNFSTPGATTEPVSRRSMTHGLERVGEELGDDPAAGAGEPVDQRVRHLRASSSCLPVPLLDAPPADGPPHRAHDASAGSQETEARRGRHGTTGTTASSVNSVLLNSQISLRFQTSDCDP